MRTSTRAPTSSASTVSLSVRLQGWGFSFIVPGFMMIALGLLIWAGLVVQPSDVGHINPDDKSGRPNYEEELVPLGGVSGSKGDAALDRKDSTARKEVSDGQAQQGGRRSG